MTLRLCFMGMGKLVLEPGSSAWWSASPTGATFGAQRVLINIEVDVENIGPEAVEARGGFLGLAEVEPLDLKKASAAARERLRDLKRSH